MNKGSLFEYWLPLRARGAPPEAVRGSNISIKANPLSRPSADSSPYK